MSLYLHMKPVKTLFSQRAVLVIAFTFAAVVTAVWFALPSSAQKNVFTGKTLAPEAGNITGRVFQDFNGNGTYDTTATWTNNGFGSVAAPIDRGISGVQVRAYSTAGVNVTSGGVATTDANGLYTLTTSDAGTGPYRVEFTSLPTGYLPSARSKSSVGAGTATNAGSTVQFVSSGATNVNLAVNHPSDYSQDNPEVVATLFREGDQISGGNNGLSTMVSFPYAAGSSDTSTSATTSLYDAPTTYPLSMMANEIGTTFGLAYARKSRRVYASAYFKRHAGFGPQGPNAIYVIDRAGGGSVVNFFTVPGTATNSHDASNWARDNGNTGWDAVGKTSLGGIALSEDETVLYVWNLSNKTLYALNATTGALITSQAAPTSLPLPSGTCSANEIRPFALQMYRGQLYVGFVCSAEGSTNVDTYVDANSNGLWDGGDYFVDYNNNGTRNTGEPYVNLVGGTGYTAPETFTDTDGNGVYNLGDARRLRAYVYTANTSTLAFSASPVFQMPLNYRRGYTTRVESSSGVWRPWSPIYRNAANNVWVTYSQPMLTDIAFDNGNLILGLRDRLVDQVGNGSLSNPNDSSNTTFYQSRVAGDIIRACGSVGSWTVEDNGRCGGNGTAPQNVAEGPGGGEFYWGDAYTTSGAFTNPTITINGKGSNHDDTGFGGVEQLAGAPDVMISNMDPIPNVTNMTYDGGIRWLSNTTGGFSKGYRLYDGAGNSSTTFGKSGGVGGSFAILSDPAPIEIGNRVWFDSNSNGVQDPGEAGIANVRVRLYSGSTVAGTALTDANGEFYFVGSTSSDSNTNDNIGQVLGGLSYNTSYSIRLDNAADYGLGAPLNGLARTILDQNTQAGDQDANDSDADMVTNPSGSPSGTWPVINLTTSGPGANNHTYDFGFVLAPSAGDVTVEGRVVTSSGAGIRNVYVILVEGDGTVHRTITGNFGYFRFDDLEAGQSVVLSVVSKRFTFANPTRVLTLKESIGDVNWISNE